MYKERDGFGPKGLTARKASKERDPAGPNSGGASCRLRVYRIAAEASNMLLITFPTVAARVGSL